MPFIGAIIGAGVGLIGSSMSASAAEDAAQTQADAAKYAADIQAQQRAPWVEAGKVALQRLQTGLAPGGEFTKQFTMADAQNMPAMQAALQQGRAAIEGSAAARGGLLSTNTLADLTKFGQQVGAGYENQAFNQFMRQQEANLAPIQSLAQVGQTQMGNVADAMSNAALIGGQAMAAGQVGGTAPYAQFLSGLGGSAQFQNALTSLLRPTGGAFTSTAQAAAGAPVPYDVGVDLQFSDERMKEDIRPVGKTFDGDNIYTYRMRSGGPKRMGVMAQELERSKPHAVHMHPSGFRMVDYDMVS